MLAYAVAHLRRVDLVPEIFDYIARIDATLDAYDGRFLIHGGRVNMLDGNWSGDLVVIEFPNRENAHAWYVSREHQAILCLRTNHSDGAAFIIEGVPDGYKAADALAKLFPVQVS
jgi:uncharacterized protein (DUF1330 family)